MTPNKNKKGIRSGTGRGGGYLMMWHKEMGKRGEDMVCSCMNHNHITRIKVCR